MPILPSSFGARSIPTTEERETKRRENMLRLATGNASRGRQARASIQAGAAPAPFGTSMDAGVIRGVAEAGAAKRHSAVTIPQHESAFLASAVKSVAKDYLTGALNKALKKKGKGGKSTPGLESAGVGGDQGIAGLPSAVGGITQGGGIIGTQTQGRLPGGGVLKHGTPEEVIPQTGTNSYSGLFGRPSPLAGRSYSPHGDMSPAEIKKRREAMIIQYLSLPR